MSARLRVLFFGNHTLGVRTLRVICERAELVGVVAHPDDPEDGVRYESVFAAAQTLGVPAIRATGKSAALPEFVRRCAPELIWITDFRYLLPVELLGLAPRGVVNLHPSLLPKYRGRAPVNWAMLRGETEFGLTAHFVDAGMDTGDIIAQRRFTLTQSQDIGDALDTLYPLYETLTAEVLGYFLSGEVPRRVQDHAQATAFPRRRPDDGLIDWSASARDVWNLIRAVAAPYPGAFTFYAGMRVNIWQAAAIEPCAPETRAGEVLASSADRLVVACRDAALVISKFEVESHLTLRAGDRLGAAAAVTSSPTEAAA